MRIMIAAIIFTIPSITSAAEVSFDDSQDGRILISLSGGPVAKFVYQDPEIPRPYFTDVYAPGGVQVTRTQPPDPEMDVSDHPLFHPGIWLSFGVLGESDYWRNKARTEFVEFMQQPKIGPDAGEFMARFKYRDQSNPNESVCQEDFRCQILPRHAGTLIVWDSTFSSIREFSFGDQEEMGLGVRMATALRSEPQARGDIPPGTGTIIDAEGRKNGAEVWGNSARWCDYSGTVDGKRAGITIFCHPNNFRPSWFHARDYGLLVANPFGRKAFRQGESSNVVVRPGEQLRLRFGILLHSGAVPDLDAAFQDYVSLSTNEADAR